MDYDREYARTGAYFGVEPEQILVDHVDLLDRDRPILDIGVGQGRHALYLAANGFVVHGIDPSEEAIRSVAEKAHAANLPVRVTRDGFDTYRAPDHTYGAVLLFGLLPILPRRQTEGLLRAVDNWIAADGLVFVTAFSTSDPAYPMHRDQWREIGRNSFTDNRGDIRSYLEPDEILELFDGWEVVFHDEAEGPLHRHGNGPEHYHGLIRAVFRR
ncbi:MAG: class I SAM-dependent methyltransferase [candidate division Zixibacteria bacterium]|nr:class I SAM-dependent methyltransferase [candidate division Zixibacteria bacterium]